MRVVLCNVLMMTACTKDAPVKTCDPRPVSQPTTDFFIDISEASGIRVDNYDENPPEGMAINDHSRLAFADINGDGFDDAVMHSLYPNATNGVPFEHLVFLNDGQGHFIDHSDASGLRNIQAGLFAFADVDNDGDQDVFAGLDVPSLGSHRSAILLNDGNGVFSPLNDSGVEVNQPTVATAVFADFNGDAKVDLFVGNGHTSYGLPDQLFWGQGDGHFSLDSGALPGVSQQPSNGAVACDYDNDGDQDLFVATYGVSVQHGHNQLWRNDGDTFTNVASQAGVAALSTGNYDLDSTGNGRDGEPGVAPEAWVGSNAFGVDCGDVDGDGDLDLWLAAISHPVSADYNRKWSDPSQLLLNQGDGTFVNGYLDAGLPFNEGDIDAGMVDFDNDGRMDLSVTRDTKYEGGYDDPDQQSWFGLMWQQDDGRFSSVGFSSGINGDEEDDLRRMKGGQNHAWSDTDHDGDLDLLVGGRDQGGGRPNFLFENQIGQENRWVAISLEGDGTNVSSDAFGTRLQITWADDIIVREKHGSRGTYNSEDSRWMHIGLGDRDCSASIEVQWPDGRTVDLDWDDLQEGTFTRLRYPDHINP
jgi:hypothetical protein